MATYNVTASTLTNPANSTLLKIGFGEPAQNTDIVKDAASAIEACGELNGDVVFLNGPASLPAACVIAHSVAHRFGAVAVFDPKLGGYVVAISHDPRFELGSLIPASEVK